MLASRSGADRLAHRVGIVLFAVALGLAGQLAAQAAPPRGGRRPAAGPPPIRWNVKPDPPARPVDLPGDREIRIQVPPSFFGGEVVYPSVPSTFVAVGRNGGANDVREVWDLARDERIGEIAGPVKLEKPYALSADGSLFAGKVPFADEVAVYDTKTGRSLARLAQPSPWTDVVEFAGPGRILTGRGQEKRFQIWDVRTGDPLQTINVSGNVSPRGIAVSPGGKHLAAATNEGRLHVFDLATGKSAGEANVPRNGNFALSCKGLAFSPDGTGLAGVFDSFGIHLLGWDVASGRLVNRHKLDAKVGLKEPLGYEGRGIQWLAGKGGWLVFGSAIVDPESGQKVYTVPSEGPDADKWGGKALGSDLVLVVSGKPQERSVRGVKLPLDRIGTAAEIVRSGGSAADAMLPPLKAADESKARRIKAGERAATWTARSDPGPAGPGPALRRTYPLSVQAREVRRVFFPGAGVAEAVVVSLAGGTNATDPAQDEGKPRRVEALDLAGGEVVSSMELPGVVDVVAVSPDGARILTVDVRDRRRVDAYSLAGQSPVAGWRPYEKGPAASRAVVWADFLDADRVLTVNRAGTLILWSIPDCRASYIAPGACEGSPVLSAGRKTLATLVGGTLRLIDTASGRVLGQAELPPSAAPGKVELKGAAFSPDGTALAALVNDGKLVRWNVATGKAAAVIPTALTPNPMPRNQVVEWCGPKHVLVDGRMLIDMDRQVHIWSYGGGTHGNAGPGGRHWFVSDSAPDRPATLGALSLPEPTVGEVEAMADDPKVPAVLRVGARVALQLEFTGPPRNADAFRASVTDQIRSRLQSYRMTVADGAPLRLVVHVDEATTGGTLQLRKLFPSMGESPWTTRSIPLRKLTCEAWLADSNGRVDLAPKQVIPLVGFSPIIHLPSGETDPELFLRDRQWDNFKNWLGGVGLPYFVSRQAGKVVRLPGFTNLAALLQ